MSGDGAEAHDDGDLEAAVAHDLREERVLEVLLLRALPARLAPVLEHAAAAHRVSHRPRLGRREWGRGQRDLQEVGELAEDGARGDDPEADPDAPHVSAEHGDDLVPEELQDGDTDTDTDTDAGARSASRSFSRKCKSPTQTQTAEAYSRAGRTGQS